MKGESFDSEQADRLPWFFIFFCFMEQSANKE